MRHRPGSGGILGFPPIISQLVLINLVVYLLHPFIGNAPNGFALIPHQILTKGMIWELVTYMFLHGGLMHVLFNMFGLVIFGSELERRWGSRDFLKYYMFTGVGAGIILVLTSYMFNGNPMVPVIGASGAIFGILIAYGMNFPHRQILLWFVIPVSARTFVAIYAFMELAMTVESRGGGPIARFAHLGGMLVGYLYLKQETLLWGAKRWIRRLQGTQNQPQGPRPQSDDPEIQARIDAILDKISREGMGALSDEEKRLLRESAERARRRQHGQDS